MNVVASHCCVCIPARNECERIPVLLSALAEQTAKFRIRVLLSINNSVDGSRDIAERCRVEMNDRLGIVVDEVQFTSDLAHAGSARRRAMDLGADLLGPDGILLTTDADTRPPPSWVEENVKALSRDLDIVGGRILLDEAEPVSPAVLAARAAQDRYWQEVRAIEDAIDPVSWDPPPRHGDHTGGSLAMSVACYVKAGRVPVVASGEDRMLVHNVVRSGGKLAHPMAIWTRVSPRMAGRATAGMADHMAKVHKAAQERQPVWLPSFAHWRQRALWRSAVRARGGAALVAELEAGLTDMPLDMPLHFDDASEFAEGRRA